MGCGASSDRYRQAVVAYDDPILRHKKTKWSDPNQADAEGRRPIAAWGDGGPDTAAAATAGWADPVQPISSPQVSLGGEWYFEAAPEVWYPFTPEISAQLLVAWYCGETHLEYLAGDSAFEVDFAACVQTDRISGLQQRIGWVPSSCQQAEAPGQDANDLPQQSQQKQPAHDGTVDPQYQWVEFDEEEQQELLAAWAAGKTLIQYRHRGYDFEIDFTRMTETNLTTGAQRLLGVQLVDEPEPGADPQPALQDRPPPNAAAGAPAAGEVPKQRADPQPQLVSDGRFPIDTGQSGPGRVAGGRPRTYVFKAAPDPSRQQKREKKWSLAPGQKPKVAGKAQPAPHGHAQQTPPGRPTAPGREATGRTSTAATPGQKPLPALPQGVEWPGELKAKRVAETLFKDMAGTRSAALEQRRQAYRAACLSWHPDKNPKHQELATAVFQFLQALKAWYFGL